MPGTLSHARRHDKPARNITELLDKSRTQRFLSVIVALRTGHDPGARVDPQVISRLQKQLLDGLAGTGLRERYLYRHIPYAALDVAADAVARLATLDIVASVSEQDVYYPSLRNSTTAAGASWGFKQGYTGEGVAVAIIDSGVAQHYFFEDRIVEEFCFSSPGWFRSSLCAGGAAFAEGPGSSSAHDHADHGTHVAGIAAGGTEWASGVARKADIIAINAATLGNPVDGPGFETPNLLAALEKVLDLTASRTIAAVNMSLGGWPVECPCDNASDNERAMKELVDLLRAEGVATIAASGNDWDLDAMGSPACISSVFSVGATDNAGVIAYFTNNAEQLDFLAPGVDVSSSVPGGWLKLSGTSMAAPHVTGGWAIMRAAVPDASLDQIAEALRRYSVPVTDEREYTWDADQPPGRVKPMIKIQHALKSFLPPQIGVLDPPPGSYQIPIDVHMAVSEPIAMGHGLKVWVTTDGDVPIENPAHARELPNDLGVYTLRLNQPGPVRVRAKAFVSLLDGTRQESETATVDYELRRPPPGPSNVSATDGAFPDRVRVSWSPVPDSVGYEVYRGSRAQNPARTAVRVNSDPVIDTTLDYYPGTGTGDQFYFFVRGLTTEGPTLFSRPDLGHAQTAKIPVQASDGTKANAVKVTWDPSPWRTPGLNTYYEVYRSTDNDLAQAQLLATVEGRFINNFPAGIVVTPAATEYLDRAVSSGITYFYWVKGIHGPAASSLRDQGDAGYAAAP